MYKVFINDKPIIITCCSKKENDFPVYILKNVVIEKIIYKLKNEKIKGINLYSTDLEQDWALFLSNFEVISAAGGLVINPKKELLFIYRNHKWDFPKGKMEKGESIKTTAVREVQEECGIFNLTILQPLLTTYHFYYQKGNKLKETHWFLMSSNYSKKLIPQVEEEITEVIFKNEMETKKALKNTYASIKLVYETYKKIRLSM